MLQRRKTRAITALTLMVGVLMLLLLPRSVLASEDGYHNMYRLYNPWSGEHLYTADLAEAKSIAEIGWRWEGVGWVAPSEGDPVYRLYNPYSGDHHFTMDRSEYDYLATIGWNQEGIGWRSDDEKSTPVYREFNPYEEIGTHNYTRDKSEDEYLASIGWNAEGIAWYGTDAEALPIQGFWLKTAAWSGDVQTYWVGADAEVAKNRFVDPSSEVDAGAGYVAYATDTGSIALGVTKVDDDHAVVADSDGHAEHSTQNGWLTSSKYAGTSQTYYFEDYLARVGEFTVDGKTYYARPDQGYIMKSATYLDEAAGRTYATNANGIVTNNESISLGEEVAKVAVACAGTADPDDAIRNTGSNAPWSKVSDARLDTWYAIADATLGIFGGNTAYSSCAQAVAGVLGATVDPDIAGDLSGKDPIAVPSSGPGTVWDYIEEHPERYERVSSASDIRPGDIICSENHIAIFVGNSAARAKFTSTDATVFQASYPDKFPTLDNWPKDYIYERFEGNVYHVVAKNASARYPYIDYGTLI